MSFRPMRRAKQQLSQEEAIELLKKAKRGVLSVTGDDGWPYGMYLNPHYNESDRKIYFHGAKAGHKIDSLRKDNRASFTVIDEGVHDPNRGPEWSLMFRSVVVFGHIEFVDDAALAADMCRGIARNFTNDAEWTEDQIRKYLAATQIIVLVPEHVAGKIVHEF